MIISFSMRRPNNITSFTLSCEEYVNNISLVHDRLRCVSCLGDFSSLTLFIINKACIQCRTGIKLKSYKGILPLFTALYEYTCVGVGVSLLSWHLHLHTQVSTQSASGSTRFNVSGCVCHIWTWHVRDIHIIQCEYWVK